MASRKKAVREEQGTVDGESLEFVRASPGVEGVVSAVGYRASGLTPGLHIGMPSPYLTLIFSFDGPVTTGLTPQQAVGGDAARTDIVVGALQQGPAYVVQPERQAGIQLAVHPLAARALFGAPAAELTDEPVTSGADLLGARAEAVRQQLAEQADWADRFATLSAYLRARAAGAGRTERVRPEVAEAWAWLARHRGAGTLHGLAGHVALSPRRLTALFRAETGVTPKQAAGLMRFEHAKAALVRAVVRGEALDLAGVAADCGYYDHSHLVRDFRRFAGASPTAWLAEECRNIQAGGHRNGEGLEP
ncbi:helix-turn-helix domain-containing protein [Streptomyces cavernicola]|uniref:Helix-turn-helix domain-containing protein n=1 Tax=Streptomyces cavernicola TaxID=3043613 RepID=A0ABT6S4A2_9ACTN|nr:helix-turn-helix domain-containing protein [Streptomyces sp. B-S-A6]MDI3402248.1 helix-turn-helix domain-containing protein [Streptomyces sp. B-S-A6]